MREDMCTAHPAEARIVTPSAGITAESVGGRPYYQIVYFDTADMEVHIGFGSYDPKITHRWLVQKFRIDKNCVSKADYVVRCKECKHLKTPRCPNGKPTCEKHGREVIAQIDYCSWGERRG